MRFPSILMLLGFALNAAAHDWQLVDAGSTLTFSGTYQKEPFQGRFKKFTAAVRYEPNDITNASFDVTIDVSSVSTDNEERDSALAGEDFFFFSKYPKAHFVTDKFSKSPDGQVHAIGTLTLREKSQPVNLDVKFMQTGEKAILDVTAKINRLDFNIGLGEWKDTDLIGSEVQVNGHIALNSLTKN